MNKQLFFGQYKRIESYFEGTDLLHRAAGGQGARDPAKPCATRCRPSSLPQPYTNPVEGSPEKVRDNLREGMRLLKEAGYEIRDQQAGQRQDRRAVELEFLSSDPSFERVILFYKPSLERLGMAVTMRTVDDANSRTGCGTGTLT